MRTAIHDCLLFKECVLGGSCCLWQARGSRGSITCCSRRCDSLSDHEFEVLERVARQMTLANRSTLFEEGGEVNGMCVNSAAC